MAEWVLTPVGLRSILSVGRSTELGTEAVGGAVAAGGTRRAGHSAADIGRGQERVAGGRLRQAVDAADRGVCWGAAQPDPLPLRLEAEPDARGPRHGEPAAAGPAGRDVRHRPTTVETVGAGLQLLRGRPQVRLCPGV